MSFTRCLSSLLASLALPLSPAYANCVLEPNNLARTPDADFTDHGNGTVTHSKTGLMWKQCVEGLSTTTTACDTGAATTHTWPQALTLAGSDATGGYTDWRLPTKAELLSIAETGCANPAINTTLFPNTPSSWTWSSAPLDQANYPTGAWGVGFSDGGDGDRVKTVGYRVRLVRSGQLFDTFDRQASYAPTAFTLTAQTGVVTSTAVESNTVTLAGLTTVTGIKVVGGQYKIGGGSYTSAPGVVSNGDQITVKLTSSASASTLATATLTVGGVVRAFDVTTAAAAPASDPGPSAPAEVRITGPEQTPTAIPGLPVRVAVGTNVEGSMIAFPTGAVIAVELGGASFTVAAQVAPTRLGLKTVMVDGVATLALYLVEGSARVAASGTGETMLVLADGVTQIISGTGGAELGVTLNGGEAVLFVRRGYVTLPDTGAPSRAASPENWIPSGQAEYRIYAGERATLDAAGQVSAHVLGNESGDGAGDPLTLDLPANLSLAAAVPKLDAPAGRLGKTLEQALADAADATLVYGQTSGVLALELDGQRVYALPLGAVPVDTARADGVSIEANGLAAVTMQGITVRLAPSVAYLNYLAEDVAAALPGATLTVNADGVLVATAGELRYALRPDWFAPVAVSKPAGFTATDDRMDYVRNFRAYTLYPAFADFARLASAITEALPGATATTNADGTVSIVSGEQHWMLKPTMLLKDAPTGTNLWWAEPDGGLRLRHADGTTQAFGIE